ncbi:RnfABCDGE type electron transport complex subunit G [Tissierella sp. MSJ-40]|uniref:Ion-translocating oxidoreductase complex subunit G n=1 Tax=Tissierella simiarum TaxID=2841534 RepID=A0ABS6EAT1_9FIRM|nr:RnfABCDGE type electron transport complex subunit G [Tissierella simiarum]MBU5440038.1 RnfABCDGE type electron transport complex subunit G [Tissierella simiarum]
MNETLKLGLILLLITVISAGVLAVSNNITAERIAEADKIANEQAQKEIVAEADEFRTLDENKLKEIQNANSNILEISEAYSNGTLVGYTIKSVSSGYGGDVVMITGFSLAGKITGMKVLNHSETPGLGANSTKSYFSDSFKNKSVTNELYASKNPSGESEVQALTSATITTNAVLAGVNAAREVFVSKLVN